jgi:hypothetical protein
MNVKHPIPVLPRPINIASSFHVRHTLFKCNRSKTPEGLFQVTLLANRIVMNEIVSSIAMSFY